MKYLKIVTMIVFMFMVTPVLANAEEINLIKDQLFYITSDIKVKTNEYSGPVEKGIAVPSRKYAVYELPHKSKITGYFYNTQSDVTQVMFFDHSYKRLHLRQGNYSPERVKVNLNDVKYIALYRAYSTSAIPVKVFEVYGEYDLEVFDEVSNVRGETYYNRIYLEWDNPEHGDLKKILIYKDDQLIEEVLAPLNYRDIRNLEPETEYAFVLKSYYDPPGEVTEGVSFTVTTKAVPEVVDVEARALNYHSAEIDFFNPNAKAVLYDGTKKIAETADNKFLLDKLEAGKKYDFVIKSLTEDGYTSKGVSVSFTLPNVPQLEEISEVKANATHERVDLSWQNPIYNPNLNFVRIYRKELTKPTAFINKMLFGSEVKASIGYAPLFETNGTYFNDLTVEPETKYEYKLTTENKSGLESEGVTIQVTTLEAPAPSMGGVTGEENENGDYIYKWTSPTTGTVKVMVGGQEYAVVPASNGEITIPKEDMKYTKLGSPDVRLIPVSESGKEGNPTNPNSTIGGAKLDFSANDLLQTSMSLLLIVGPFILLALAFIFVPRIIELLRQAAKKRNDLARRERT